MGWSPRLRLNRTIIPVTSSHFRARPTGVGGILRDIFTMGARPVAALDSLRFGPIVTGNGVREEDSREQIGAFLLA